MYITNDFVFRKGCLWNPVIVDVDIARKVVN